MTATQASAQQPATDVLLEVRGLSHAYGTRVALKKVSFGIRVGERFAFLGPNGSGKSTLFRILSTLLAPTSGSAKVLGHDVSTHPNRVREGIGVVFQSPSLDKKLTVRAHAFSKGAKALIEKAGGTAEVIGAAAPETTTREATTKA